MKSISKNINEFENIVISFVKELIGKEKATIIALSGDLGAGKTFFVKSVAKYFNIKEEITSPTFVIQKEYQIRNHHIYKKMIHIDAYRLDDKSELEYLGWDEIVQNKENLVFIEWPEQVKGINIPNVININIKILEGESREVDIINNN